jgi:hypothetical protein
LSCENQFSSIKNHELHEEKTQGFAFSAKLACERFAVLINREERRVRKDCPRITRISTNEKPLVLRLSEARLRRFAALINRKERGVRKDCPRITRMNRLGA